MTLNDTGDSIIAAFRTTWSRCVSCREFYPYWVLLWFYLVPIYVTIYLHRTAEKGYIYKVKWELRFSKSMFLPFSKLGREAGATLRFEILAFICAWTPASLRNRLQSQPSSTRPIQNVDIKTCWMNPKTHVDKCFQVYIST